MYHDQNMYQHQNIYQNQNVYQGRNPYLDQDQNQYLDQSQYQGQSPYQDQSIYQDQNQYQQQNQNTHQDSYQETDLQQNQNIYPEALNPSQIVHNFWVYCRDPIIMGQYPNNGTNKIIFYSFKYFKLKIYFFPKPRWQMDDVFSDGRNRRTMVNGVRFVSSWQANGNKLNEGKQSLSN